MKVKNYLLATASSVAATAGGTMVVSTAASAADMPIKAYSPPPVAAAPSWAGAYIGVNAGGAWQHAQTHGSYVTDVAINVGGTTRHSSQTLPVSNSLSTVGFIGGGQIGYNWQSGSLVYGLEADFSGLTGKTGLTQAVGKTTTTTSNRINWMATFRGRFGFVVGGDTLLYATGGLAVAKVTNTFGYSGTTWQDHSTRTGYVAGLGAEHMIDKNWIVRIEGLYADLGSNRVNCVGCSGGGKTTTFANQVGIVRVGLSYKLPY